MSIPYNHYAISWDNYELSSGFSAMFRAINRESNFTSERTLRKDSYHLSTHLNKVVSIIFIETIRDLVLRTVQFIRDSARVVLKVPIRVITTPSIVTHNWKERERTIINMKLPLYSFAQVLLVGVKFATALLSIPISVLSPKYGRSLLNQCQEQVLTLDGRAAQLEALKEEGRVHAKNPQEFANYKAWLYQFDPKECIDRE